ncbi:MAG: glycosyltransferase family 2 protein [Planctomycetota bacterium]
MPKRNSTTPNQFLVALPVYNEVNSVDSVLDEVSRYADQILVVDDGSTDGTSDLLSERDNISVVRHPKNLGYGAALVTGFKYACDHDFDVLVTVDCDGQHEPQRIQSFVKKIIESDVDIVSGSRYLKSFDEDSPPPEQRRLINYKITRILNQRLGFQLTDAFCGFKAYKTSALLDLEIQEKGYAMPLELWVQAAFRNLTVAEVAVPRIYLDANRSFGEQLDDPEKRLRYYCDVLNRSLAALPADSSHLSEMRVTKTCGSAHDES